MVYLGIHIYSKGTSSYDGVDTTILCNKVFFTLFQIIEFFEGKINIYLKQLEAFGLTRFNQGGSKN